MANSSIYSAFERMWQHTSLSLDNKVDKVSGKGLSTNDYTTTEKNKLSGIATGAEVNQNAFSNVKIGSTTIAADAKTDTLTLAAGSNITLTPDATNDTITISSTDTTYTSLKNPNTLDFLNNAGTEVDDYDGSSNVKLKAGTNVQMAASNGTVTISSTDTDTHYTTHLKTGNSETATANAAATNGNVYLNLLDDNTVRDSHNIVGSGGTTVASDATGKITITTDLSNYATKSDIAELPQAMIFRGSLGTNGTKTSLPTATDSTVGDVYKVITAGTYASKAAKVGDVFICSSVPAWELIPSADEPNGTVTNITAENGLKLKSGTSITSTGTIQGIDATTSAKGVVQLSSETGSNSEDKAATPKAVKAAYDKAETALSTASSKVSKSGDTMTGTLTLKPASGEGGQVILSASSADTTNNGIIIDTANGDFRIFGEESGTKTGFGTILNIDPYDATITGGYSFDGNAATATKATSDGNGNNIVNTYATKTSVSNVEAKIPTTYAGSSSAGGAANSVKTNLTIQFNGGTTEGTNKFTFNGSTAKTVNIPLGSKDVAGITIVYPAASCTTFSSDSGTITPLAAQKAAKMFGITRPPKKDTPQSVTVNAISRWENTNGDLKNSKIIIEDVKNTADVSKNGQVIAIPGEGNKKMVYGYCTDQVDGTTFIGGVFDKDATVYPYAAGLAIGGTSGNLLWKGNVVATTNQIPTIPTSLKNPYSLTIQGNGTTLTNGTYDGSAAKTVNITPASIGADSSGAAATAESNAKNYADGKFLPLAGGTLTGTLYTSAATPLLIGTNGKVGMRAATTDITNVGQINISNSWWTTGNQWGAQMSALNGATNKRNGIRVSHEGLVYESELESTVFKSDINGNVTAAGYVKGSNFRADDTPACIRPSDSNEINIGSNANYIYIGYDNRAGSAGAVNTYNFGRSNGGTGSTDGDIVCGSTRSGRYVQIGSCRQVYDSTNECLNFTFV